MSERQPKEWLNWICSSQDLNELRNNYDQWADNYETDISKVWELVPKTAALILSEYLEDKQSKIFDFGAGTGMVGVALAELGFEKIIGMDISPAMLTKAADKGVYSSLVCCSIGDETCKNLGKAKGIIATGVFAQSHAGSVELNTLQDSVESGGVLVFTARQSFLLKIQEVINQPGWTFLTSQVMPIYEDPMHILAYKIQHVTKNCVN